MLIMLIYMIMFITIIVIMIIIKTHDHHISNRDSFTINFPKVVIIIGNSSRSIVIMTILTITNCFMILSIKFKPR